MSHEEDVYSNLDEFEGLNNPEKREKSLARNEDSGVGSQAFENRIEDEDKKEEKEHYKLKIENAKKERELLDQKGAQEKEYYKLKIENAKKEWELLDQKETREKQLFDNAMKIQELEMKQQQKCLELQNSHASTCDNPFCTIRPCTELGRCVFCGHPSISIARATGNNPNVLPDSSTENNIVHQSAISAQSPINSP